MGGRGSAQNPAGELTASPGSLAGTEGLLTLFQEPHPCSSSSGGGGGGGGGGAGGGGGGDGAGGAGVM